MHAWKVEQEEITRSTGRESERVVEVVKTDRPLSDARLSLSPDPS